MLPSVWWQNVWSINKIMNSKLVLVTGGTRSGKSEFAEKYLQAYTKKAAYIATAEILDEEMQKRVELHQARRDSFWENYEAPYQAEKIVTNLPASVEGVLLDCLTIYTANLLYQVENKENFMEKVAFIQNEIAKLIIASKQTGKLSVFVTNEVGAGIVPANKLSREYCDISGWVNQQVANACDEVYFVVCGQAVDVKKYAHVLPSKVV